MGEAYFGEYGEELVAGSLARCHNATDMIISRYKGHTVLKFPVV